MRFLLASKSPARRQTLINAGITPLVRVSAVDEDAVLANLPGGRAFSGGSTEPSDEVLALARAKCSSVAELVAAGDPGVSEGLPEDEALVVVGCDSMLEINGTMAGKPRLPEVAVERIRAMRGSSAILWTGHHAVLLSPVLATSSEGHARREVLCVRGASASTIVHFGAMSDAEIDAYVASGEPLKVAGSFTIDALGGPFIRGVEGDHHSVVGISLPLLHEMFTEMGIFWPDLWDHRRPD